MRKIRYRNSAEKVRQFQTAIRECKTYRDAAVQCGFPDTHSGELSFRATVCQLRSTYAKALYDTIAPRDDFESDVRFLPNEILRDKALHIAMSVLPPIVADIVPIRRVGWFRRILDFLKGFVKTAAK